MAEVDEYFPEDVPPESDPELEQDYTPTEEIVESYSPEDAQTSGYGEQNDPLGDTEVQSYTPEQLDALAAENGVDAGNESVESYTPEQLDALAAENGVDAGDGGNIPESALYRNEEMNRGINPYNQYDTGTFEGPLFDTSSSQEQVTKALLQQAQNQATLQQRYNQTTRGDWRVRIRLAPGATYLYQDASNQLLAPLRASNGVIFPYTPTIQTSYAANYDKYDLTHSNYRGYFYKNSVVNDISITGTFTAQDTVEAQYLLAVIVFLRSATKMFYGKDEFRGAPPPLVELSGYGEYQYNNHPCLISNFSYSLPNDVDYIQVSPNNQGINLTNRQSQISSTPWSNVISQVIRLSNAMNGGLPRGANYNRGDLGSVGQTVYGTGQTTYVPTKMELQLTLLPVQTRQQVSQQFSVKNFANGNLLKGGFW